MPDPARLALAALGRLPAEIARPNCDPAGLAVGIVHLGLGAFARAHAAVYADDLAARDPNWGICGVSMKTPRAIAPLAAQQGLYTVCERDRHGSRLRVIGALRETMFAPADPAALVRRMADPRVRVVTLTVTEKGYCHDPATGRLDLGHPDIRHDLEHPGAPVSAVGFLVAALDERRRTGAGALNVVCCDNLPHNGRAVEELVGTFARARARTRRMDRVARRVPVHDGRPDRSGDDRRGRRRCRAAAGCARRSAGRRGAVPAVGDRGALRGGAAEVGGGGRTGRA